MSDGDTQDGPTSTAEVCERAAERARGLPVMDASPEALANAAAERAGAARALRDDLAAATTGDGAAATLEALGAAADRLDAAARRAGEKDLRGAQDELNEVRRLAGDAALRARENGLGDCADAIQAVVG